MVISLLMGFRRYFRALVGSKASSLGEGGDLKVIYFSNQFVVAKSYV